MIFIQLVVFIRRWPKSTGLTVVGYTFVIVDCPPMSVTCILNVVIKKVFVMY